MTLEREDRWEEMRRQVALWGRVTSGVTGQAVNDADIRIVDGPVAQPPAATARPDGIYFFLNLPPGQYVVAAADRRGRLRANATGEVAWDEQGNVQPAVVHLELKEAAVTPAPESLVERPRGRTPRQQQRRKATGPTIGE